MRFLALGTLFLVLLDAWGCSNFYDGFQAQQRETCYKLPYPDQEECFRQIDGSYEDYQRERKVVAEEL
ncbi:MAG: hypothetical protein ACN4GW_15330 [Desulforhopalus sp.]